MRSKSKYPAALKHKVNVFVQETDYWGGWKTRRKIFFSHQIAVTVIRLELMEAKGHCPVGIMWPLTMWYRVKVSDSSPPSAKETHLVTVD